MDYVDGYVVAVPTRNKEAYLALAADVATIFKACGAKQLVECWGDDVPQGKLTSFPMAVQCQDDETVVFSWITWPSRAARDAGMLKFKDHPRMRAQSNDPMPFDGKRMIFGGFQMILDA